MEFGDLGFYYKTLLINTFKTDSMILDAIIVFVIFNVFTQIKKKDMIQYIKTFFSFTKSNKNIIKYTAQGPTQSEKFRAIMHYITTYPSKDIKRLKELIHNKWNYRDDEITYEYYMVDQDTQFLIDDNIYGCIENFKEEDTRTNNATTFKDVIDLNLYSYKNSIQDLIAFEKKCTNIYKQYLKDKINDKHFFIECTWDSKEKEMKTNVLEWESFTTFDNKFFDDKLEIIKQIDFFINNKEYYKEKGLPYSLKYLLHGEPGCGKTSFLKCIANKTKKHIVYINLSDKMDLQKLKEFLLSESINNDLHIPLKDRIYVLEDIDELGKIVLKRKENDEDDDNSVKCNKITPPIATSQLSNSEVLKAMNEGLTEVKLDLNDKPQTNNMSYLLNIMDGPLEIHGMIMIMTTNKPEVLDDALIRPGRINTKIQFKKCSSHDIQNILEFYYKTKLTDDIQQYPFINRIYSHAYITNICMLKKCINEAFIAILNNAS
jgi:ATP-dependent Zn protease